MKEQLVIKNLPFLVGSFDEVKDEIMQHVIQKRSLIVLPCSLHDIASVSLYPEFKKFYERVDICTTDGMPVVWWAMLQTKRKVDRVYGPDLMKSILIDTQSVRFRHVFCGSSPFLLNKLIDKISLIAPKINIVGLISPSIELKQTDEERQSLQQIIGYKPSVLWLGVSSPKQVILAVRWKRHFPHAVIVCVGAAFDMISGVVPSTPKWLQAIGFEWFVRLMVEPRRLYKRYLVLIPRFLFGELRKLIFWNLS